MDKSSLTIVEEKDNHLVNKESFDAKAHNAEISDHDHDSHHHHDMSEEHSKIGISLVTGFIFMLLVDQIGGGGHSHSLPSDPEVTGHAQHRSKITATLGLVVHAAGKISWSIVKFHDSMILLL